MSYLASLTASELQAIVVTAALLLGIVLAVVIVLIHRSNYTTFEKNSDLRHFEVSSSERTCWIGGILVGLALIAATSWAAQRDEATLRADREAMLEAHLRGLGCPPKQAGDTQIIILTIETSADAHTETPLRTTGCSRIVERPFQRYQRRPLVQAAK